MKKEDKITLAGFILIVVMLFVVGVSQAQHEFRLNNTEYFTVGVAINPCASIDCSDIIDGYGLSSMVEVEYVGFPYVKVGMESFPQLQGGYFDVHAVVGVNFTSGMYEHFRYYTGFRLARVSRNNDFRVNYGGEVGLDFELSDNFTIGTLGRIDRRFDQEIFFWEVENKFSAWIAFKYKWYWKGQKTTH